MPHPPYDFRTHVLQTPAIGVPLLFADLSQPEVSNANMTFEIDHDILWFEIPIDYVFGVQVFYC